MMTMTLAAALKRSKRQFELGPTPAQVRLLRAVADKTLYRSYYDLRRGWFVWRDGATDEAFSRLTVTACFRYKWLAWVQATGRFENIPALTDAGIEWLKKS